MKVVKMSAEIIPLSHPEVHPRISVVIVSFMTGPALIESLHSVLQDPDIFEVILVDNGNSPDARHRLSQFIMAHDKIRLLQGHGNVGFAKGCNYGASMATGDFVLFLNPDAILKPMAARKLAENGTGRARPWVTGGKLLSENGQEQRGGRRRAVTPLSAFISFTGLHKLPGLKSIHMESEPLPLGPIEVDVVSGAFLMLDRPSFDEIGGFDERYFLHVEDIDLCRRAKLAGGDVVFVPDAAVMHYGSTSRVPRMKVEKEKFKGFVIYFFRYSDHWWAKALAIISAPAIAMAILGRARWIAFKAGLRGQ